MTRIIAACIIIFVAALLYAGEKVQTAHVTVSHDGFPKPYAEAIARMTETARAAAIEQFGLDLPDRVTVVCEIGRIVRLFNDGSSVIRLTVKSEDDLKAPAVSGVWNIYGFCHEIGHLGMYRAIKDHSFLESSAKEGWAHYAGSRLVDIVYAKEGEKLWPDGYDYRADGMKRFDTQRAPGAMPDDSKGALLWAELLEKSGDKAAANVFAALKNAKIDSAKPEASVLEALTAAKLGDDVLAWWAKAGPTFARMRATSDFKLVTLKRGELPSAPKELAADDGKEAGRSSLAGSGHAVRFDAPSQGCYLTAVRLYGSRYGGKEGEFRVWLCDSEFRAITAFSFPYAQFAPGKPKWIELPVTPTLVPEQFFICVGFNPTAQHGVFLNRDKAASGSSFTGLPGDKPRPFDAGDWMLRAVVRMKPGEEKEPENSDEQTKEPKAPRRDGGRRR